MKTIQLIALILTIFFYYLGFSHEARPLFKSNDKQPINAAIVHKDGTAYFFVGKYFHQYNMKTSKRLRIGKIGKDGWYGLPTNVDAAIVHPDNGKGYFFKGNAYHRYDFVKRKVDKKGVLNKDGWKGIEGPMDAALIHPNKKYAYFLKGSKYHRFNFSLNKVDKIGQINKDGFKGISFQNDAAIEHPNGKLYFFKDSRYTRYSTTSGKEKTGIIGKDGWKNLFQKIDAVFYRNKATNLFQEGVCVQYDNINQKREATKKIGYELYPGVPYPIDAAFIHSKNKRIYFFRGVKYYRYNVSSRKVDKIGVIGKDGWHGVPSNLDAGATLLDDVYFFKGYEYYVFNLNKNKIIEKGLISKKFKGVPNDLDAVNSFYDGHLWSDFHFYKKNYRYYYPFSHNKGKIERADRVPDSYFLK